MPSSSNASIVYIGVNQGEINFTGPDKGLTTHHITYYAPSSDADGDGYPDAGAVPIAAAVDLTSVDTRLAPP